MELNLQCLNGFAIDAFSFNQLKEMVEIETMLSQFAVLLCRLQKSK